MEQRMTTAKDNPGAVKIGSILQDNDVRNHGARVVVDAIGPHFAGYFTGRRRARIRLDRIHLDGKRRSQGYNLVREDGRAIW
jgi:hypothetical protein